MLQDAFGQTPGLHGGNATPPNVPTDPAAILAVVGERPILVGELQPKVDATIEALVVKAGRPVPPEKLPTVRTSVTRQALAQAIQNKMLRESFLLEQVATQSKEKRDEVDQQLVQRARQMFRESELPKLIKQYKTTDRGELDRLLRKKGSSLSARQAEFVDMMLGHMYIQEKVKKDPSVSLAEIVSSYQLNRSKYERKERARWEQLSVHFDRVPDVAEAEKLIAAMGRETFYGGNMQAVAKKSSHDALASSGGVHDWTDRGALASEIMEQQIFTIELNKLSEIIRDSVGLHIIRVLDRTPAGFVPLAEVQDEIRGKIKQQKVLASQQKALDSMQTRVAVWSLYPEDVPGAKPLPQSVRR